MERILTLSMVFQAGSWFLRIVEYAILVYVVLSWFQPNFKFYYWLASFIAPFVRPFRRLSMWITVRFRVPLDFSCWFAVFGLHIINVLWWRLYLMLYMLL